jgi:hypothetical protein
MQLSLTVVKSVICLLLARELSQVEVHQEVAAVQIGLTSDTSTMTDKFKGFP